MKIVELCKRNFYEVKKMVLSISGSIFTLFSIVLSFVTWDDIGIKSMEIKALIFMSVAFMSGFVSVLTVCYIRKCNKVYENGTGKIILLYGDLMKIAFPKRNKMKKLVIIPVNTSFDTIVDRNVAEYKTTLVSPMTIHGMWIENMLKEGRTLEELDTMISKQLQDKIVTCTLERKEKKRGKLKCYEIGTIISIVGEKGITYFLVALSEFDENNNAQAKKNEVIKCIGAILEHYDIYGQGYGLYLPLMGTGLSRAGLSHEEALQTIKAFLQLHNEKIHGEINIVISYKDKSKVSIFR